MKRALFVVLLVLAFTGVRTSAQGRQSLTIFAAASLTDAFKEIGAAFEASNPNVGVVLSFGSSSTLATQLVEGAPADVFASANNAQMTVARDGKRIAGTPRTFVKNRLILIAPANNPAGVTSLRDLAKPGIKLIVAAPDVPVRTYTDTMLERLAADPAYGEPYRTAVLANVVSEEQNVRQVSAKIALGEGDAGVVYASDVTPEIASKVIAISIPDYLNTIASYPIAVVKDSAHPELAQAFIDFVLADVGQDTLVKWNFIAVRIPAVPYVVTLPTEKGTFTVDGQVSNPLTLTADDLRSQFTSQTVEVTFQSGTEKVTTAFTGVPLWQVISAAQPNLNADIRNDRLSVFIVVTSTDSYQAVIAWGEIDPEFAGRPILVAYEEKGAPITDVQGPIRLVVPGDVRGGRYVSGIANISLRDAPVVSR